MNVYVVSVDDYESSEIIGVYASRKSANKAARVLRGYNGDYSNVHEHELQE